MSIYKGKALNPLFEPVYQQALQELNRFGRSTKDRFFCRRIHKYVSQAEVNTVAAFETVLDALEDTMNTPHALVLVRDDSPGYVDVPTLNRYIGILKQNQLVLRSCCLFNGD
jgi:hypothetical protein